MTAEELYDLYLDACLHGDDVEAPEPFAARHGVRDEGVIAQLRALHEASLSKRQRQAPPVPHDRLGEFRLLRPLGEGGMGKVYEAVQESLDRRVALKVVRADFAASTRADERFRREAQAIARLSHRNIVDVYAMGEDKGVRYLAMELLAGHSLDELLRNATARGRTLRVDRLVRWGAKLARALQHAHDNGVVHRDVKPGNVHIDPDDEPRLLDFGIARDTQAAHGTLTRTFAGSPLFAAPEQIMGRDIDGRADVYALGITLYRALTGRVPFEGGTLDHVIKRALTDEPMAPRHLNPSVSRELDTVILKAIEKEPHRRYATAAAFADDLEAILGNRPIAARPPGLLARTAKWARRHPARATAIVAVLLAAVGAGVWADLARRERKQAARDKLAEARRAVTDYSVRRARHKEQEAELASLRHWQARRTLTPAEVRRLDVLEEQYEDFERMRDIDFYRALDLIRAAEELDAGIEGGDDLKAGLYMERYREAEIKLDRAAADYYEELVLKHDRAGRFRAELKRYGALEIHIEPADAELFLFRHVLQSELYDDGERRLVPVPIHGAEPPIRYGTVCLRVVKGAGAVRAGDHILEVAGHPVRGTFLVDEAREPVRRLDRLVRAGEEDLPSPWANRTDEVDCVFERDGEEYTVRSASGFRGLGVTLMTPAECAAQGDVEARVLRGDEIVTMRLPKGLAVRPTAQPLLCWDAARVGRKPEVEKGPYLLVARKEGYEDLRFGVKGGNDGTTRLRMLPAGTTPPGFIHIPDYYLTTTFWIMEREVNAAEYLEFLNDPAVRARIDASDRPILFPRDSRTAESGGYWSVKKGEPVRLPSDWGPDWPVLGVSYHDAKAYAAWRTERDPAPVTYDLPGFEEWAAATRGGVDRQYAWGDSFRARWCNSCRSHKFAFPEPSFRYPVDETVHGLFDCTGNASEWLDAFYDESRKMRYFGGGCWGETTPFEFTLRSRGQTENRPSGSFGFRLVRRP